MLASGAGLILIKVLNVSLGFATVTVFARLMPPEMYGRYALALTLAQFLALPLQMGIPVLLTREIAAAEAQDCPDVIKGVRTWSRRILLIATLILGAAVIGSYGIIVAVGWPILSDMSWPLVLLIVVLIPIIAEMKRVMGILNGYRFAAQSRMPDGVVRPVLLLVAGGLGLWLGWFTETGLLAVYVLSGMIAALFGWVLVRRVEAGKPRYDGLPVIRSADWWTALWPLTFFAAAGTIKTYADILMLGAMDTTSAVAFYRVATQIAGVALLSQVAVNAVLGPRLAALYANDKLDQLQGLAVRGSRIAFAAASVFALCVILVGRGGFTLLFGDDYGPAYPLAVILSFGTAASAYFGGTTMMLNMTRREKSTATYAVWTAIANIALNALLIPLLGAIGAALATVATTLAMQIFAWRRIVVDLGQRTDAFARISRKKL